MPLNLASPGIVVREVDLTIGRVDTATDKTAAIVAPFTKGPTNLPTLIENEQQLIDTFGEPQPIDNHFEHWLVASSYLAYGGVLSVVRATDTNLKNAKVNVGGATEVQIDSLDDYINKGYDTNTITDIVVAARNPGSWADGLKVAMIDARADQTLTIDSNQIANLKVGFGVTQTALGKVQPTGAGTTVELDGMLKGIITNVDTTNNQIDVKLTEHITGFSTATGIGSTAANVDYQPNGLWSFVKDKPIGVHLVGAANSTYGCNVSAEVDWFDQQKIELTNSTILWNNIADRPSTSAYAAARSSRFDEVHVVVFDDKGVITGNAGTVLEKNLNLSKAKDAEFSAGSPSYWRKFLENSSSTIFGGNAPAGITTTSFQSGNDDFDFEADNGWDQNAQNIKFGAVGNTTLTLAGGKNYDGSTGIGTTGALAAGLDGIVEGYGLFENSEEYDIDFLLMGAAYHTKEKCQALANKIISVAEIRKDAIAFVSPNRGSFINDTEVGSGTVSSSADITDNVISFYSPVTSTTYGVFDSGYKYMYDRFVDSFRYVPMNGDIAGMCARNDINQFPWFSPAGTARGTVLNAVKLAYNPSQLQRDKLYSNRINPIIFSPGAGIILFGDKTGYGKASAFDRINVRRLFIYLEDAISAAARDQLFEFNDEITRTNFVNIVEPFLRDVQSKRGIYDFRVVCDETNNTGAVIDNNEFVADIFIKPARSINFIGLTFVATRTGISFEEVIGTV